MFKKNWFVCVRCLVSLVLLTSASWGADKLFGIAQAYRSGGSDASSVAVGDVNGDGKLDLVVANQCSDSDNCPEGGTVGVLLGNGDGTFQAVHNYSSGGQLANFVALADVNGDGKLDVLVANLCTNCFNSSDDQGRLGVLLGNGDGTFQTVHAFNSGGYGTRALAAADVNGDGKLDLVVANFCGGDPGCHRGTVGVLLGNGDDTFQTAQTYDSAGYGPESVAVADVNRDGKLDLVVTDMCPIDNFSCQKGGVVGVLLGNGDGTFQTAQTYNSGGFFASAVAVADINGDSKLDLLVTNWCVQGKSACFNDHTGSGVIGVLLGNGDGTFQKAQRYGSGGYGAGSIAIADANGDGKLDLLVANETSTNRTTGDVMAGILLGNGDGTFQKAERYGSGGYNTGGGAIAAADVSGDGKLDLLVANKCFPEFGECNHAGGVAVFLARYTTTTNLSSSLNPSNYGHTVTLTAAVTSPGPTPAGRVNFMDGTTKLGTARLSDGMAKLTKSKLAVGTHPITAEYLGDAACIASTSSVLYQVVQ
jgi:hypothetical protein